MFAVDLKIEILFAFYLQSNQFESAQKHINVICVENRKDFRDQIKIL